MNDAERDKILTETNKDVGYILERLTEGKETFKEHRTMFAKHDKRISDLEGNQQFLTGKLSLVLMGIGAAVLFVADVVRGVLFKY